ncbi:UDP-3-O-acyl-N-acetylglucosamine deacetylase [Phyllobacterium myrsinacearum]|uniref:UDP-3-O-acyl-N-acetylglucosamine deacetylase n=1 Tax=Phyllobacterium myrsinacearum TaxID=28101 RepID=A0A839EIT4_9HYPH|nr:UDP-3-O-acyl-N-acetylglucosamine deacetylase [Phyllobacterium myrsinacearum]MBA8878709.1 UDP-3-O-[3-hydroxymyristoyl] N-acetylglucosamine deacetylase [Phyllobacterium myrsinacearum]
MMTLTNQGPQLRDYQMTIAEPVSLSGIGVHSGTPVSMTFLPSDANTGIVFHRIDPAGTSHAIRALVSEVGTTDLSTTLANRDGVTISTVEHVMAAIAGAGIDNLIIEIDGPEVPIVDGTSAAFLAAFDQAGFAPQTAKRRFIRVLKPSRIEAGESWAEFLPYDGTRYEVEIDFETPVIGRQTFSGDMSEAVFRDEISRARTFGFMRDVEKLWAAGLALASSLDNSLVIGDDNNVINPGGLRFRDEFVRHKTLDAVGDLALAGAPFIGCFRSHRGGHRLNAMALRALLADHSAFEIVEAAGHDRGAPLIAVNAPVFAPWAV